MAGLNGYEAVGQALQQGGAAIGQLGDEWDKKRQYMEKLIADRAQVEYENRLRQESADRENAQLSLSQNADKRSQAEADRKAQADADATRYQQGQTKPGINPAPVQPMATYDGSQPDTGAVISSKPVPQVPISDEERLQLARQTGQISVKDDLELGVKAAKKSTDDAKLNEFKAWVAAAGPAVERVGRSSAAANALMVQGLSRFADIPGARDDIKAITQKEPAPVNVSTGNGRNQSSIRSSAEQTRKGYEKAVNPYLSMEAIKKSTAWGTGVGDFNLLKLMATIDNNGKSPTDLDMKESATKHGWGDVGNLARGIIGSSAKITPDVREEMLSDARQQTQIRHDAYGQTLEELRNEATLGGFKPDATVIPGGTHHLIDSTLTANAIPQTADTQTGKGPKVGTVSGGYVFLGGDPNDPHSWGKTK